MHKININSLTLYRFKLLELYKASVRKINIIKFLPFYTTNILPICRIKLFEIASSLLKLLQRFQILLIKSLFTLEELLKIASNRVLQIFEKKNAKIVTQLKLVLSLLILTGALSLGVRLPIRSLLSPTPKSNVRVNKNPTNRTRGSAKPKAWNFPRPEDRFKDK